MGDMIAGRYELIERIGAGGMAEVHRARDRRLDRIVALKLLNRVYTEQPAFVERFRREARAAASLDHPAIVPTYDWGQSDDSYFIVMAHVAGPTLNELADRDGPLPFDEVCRIIGSVAGGLQHAHDNGIVHRDIKPRNILIDDQGNPRITDFGIAQAAGQTSLTETSIVLGTAHYMSPEQASRNPIDARSDIYSLGVVTYELLAGRPPFQGESIVQIAMQHVHDDPPGLRSIRPEIPLQLERIVLRCLAKQPEERFQSASELRAGLDRVRENPAATSSETETVAVGAAGADDPAVTRIQERTPPRQPSRRAARPPRRQRRFAWAGIAIVALALVGLLALLISQLDGSDNQEAGIVGDEAGEQSGQETDPAGSGDDEGADTDAPEAPADEGDNESEEPPPEADEQDPDEQEQTEGDEQAPEEQQESEGNEQAPVDEDEEGDQAQLQELPGDGVCDGSYESVTAERLLVPGQATCIISGGSIDDDIVVQPGGTLQASNVEFFDDVDANQAAALSLDGGSYVEGNVQFSDGGSVRIAQTTVDGNLEFESNSEPVEIVGNSVGGNVITESNTGGVTISDNLIEGNLECEGNDPAPGGGGNDVAGDREDQCSDL